MTQSMPLSRGRRGFTIIEVLVAAAILGMTMVYTARPMQQAILASSVAADKATALHWAKYGLEWARSYNIWYYDNGGEINFGRSTGYPDNKYHLVDQGRNVEYTMYIRKTLVSLPGNYSGSSTVKKMWRIESTVEWTRGGRANSLKLFTYQNRWLASGVTNGTA